MAVQRLHPMATSNPGGIKKKTINQVMKWHSIIVTGLTNGTAYTFTANNAVELVLECRGFKFSNTRNTSRDLRDLWCRILQNPDDTGMVCMCFSQIMQQR
jgi:hypothetical protein